MSIDHLRDVDTIAIVGGGTMGHGIAQVFATSGYDVVLNDIEEEILSNALEKIEKSLEKLDQAEPDAVLDRIETTTNAETAFSDAGLVVEAVPEDIGLKRDIFGSIDEYVPEDAILATNTSTLPITEIATATDRPERVVGMHFSNPVQLMEVVEVVRGERTDEEVFEAVQEICEDIDKHPILIEKDVPGFLLNRINLRFWLEAVRQVETGTQCTDTIDAAVQRLGFPMGPFEVMDFSGIDVVTMAARSMRERDVDLHVPTLLEDKFDSEEYGIKTGEGFYSYPEPDQYARVDIPRENRYQFDPKELIAPAVNEAAWLLTNGVTTRAEIDEAMQIGMNWPRGLLTLADEYGIDRLIETIEELRDRSGWEEYEPHPLLYKMVEDGDVGLASGSGFYEYEYERKTFNTVRYERREFIAVITLNRPDRLNALDKPSWEGLSGALEQAAADEDIRVTVLRGAGDAFCAGDDIAELRGFDSIEDARNMIEGSLGSTVRTFREHSKPIIAAVDGVANGGGCELVLLSDLAVASPGSDFALPEAKIGAMAPISLTYGRASLGRKDVMELTLTGEQFPATRAKEMGIVNYVVDSSQIDDVARELARKTTASGPEAIVGTKDLWKSMEDDILELRFKQGLERLSERVRSEEGKKGLEAFLYGEDPPWQR